MEKTKKKKKLSPNIPSVLGTLLMCSCTIDKIKKFLLLSLLGYCWKIMNFPLLKVRSGKKRRYLANPITPIGAFYL